MKKIIFLLLVFASSIANTTAQQVFSPNTGDVEMDGVLNDINTKAKNDPVAFSQDVATRFGVPKTQVEQAAKTMNPGDVFMSAQVASITKKPFEEVTKTYQSNKEKGWGEIAKQMGIKPGSPEFHEMKKSMKSNGKKGNEGHGNSDKGNGNGGNGHGHGKK